MGNRVSIQFKDDDGTLSAVLFSHWSGLGLVHQAREFVDKLRQERINREVLPLDRMEAGIVLINFIRHITSSDQNATDASDMVDSDFSCLPSPEDGEQGEAGHHVIYCGKRGVELNPEPQSVLNLVRKGR